MIDFLAHFHEPMLLDEELIRRRTRTMHLLIAVNLLICVTLGFLYFFEGILTSQILTVFSLWAVSLLVTYILLLRGHVTISGFFMTFMAWLILSYSAAFIHGNISGPLITTIMLIAAAAGLLLGRMFGYLLVGLGIFSLVSIFVATQSGILPPPVNPLTPQRILIMQLLNLALFTLISGYTSKLIRDSMQRSRNHQDELLDANRELEAIRASLEYQVHERTSEILQQKQYFEALMHNNPLAIAALDQNHRVVAINQAFEKLFGYLPVEAIGHDLDSLVTTPETLAEALIYTHRSQIGEQVLGHGKRRRKDGSLVDVDIFGVPVTIEGKQIGILGIYQDVSARKQSEEQLQYLATHDLLTGLPNRNLFNDRLNRAFERSRRNGHSFAVFFLDLDGFKQVNDTFGHHKGDLVLQQVANRLKNCVRESDTLARLGGDEFSYIFEDLNDIQSAIHVSSKILDQLKEPFVLDEKEVWITASIGISLYPDDGEDTDTLLKKADAAMYQAKEEGGDTISLSNGSPPTIQARNTELWIG